MCIHPDILYTYHCITYSSSPPTQKTGAITRVQQYVRVQRRCHALHSCSSFPSRPCPALPRLPTWGQCWETRPEVNVCVSCDSSLSGDNVRGRQVTPVERCHPTVFFEDKAFWDTFFCWLYDFYFLSVIRKKLNLIPPAKPISFPTHYTETVLH